MPPQEIAIKPTGEFENISIEEATRLLFSSRAGLTDAEARSRTEKLGYNEMREKARNPIVDLVSRLWGPVAWHLEPTIVLSAVIELGRNSKISPLYPFLQFYRTGSLSTMTQTNNFSQARFFAHLN
ncbi:MAG: cation-transporting P-type ATPase [Nitrososphaerales archaeon]